MSCRRPNLKLGQLSGQHSGNLRTKNGQRRGGGGEILAPRPERSWKGRRGGYGRRSCEVLSWSMRLLMKVRSAVDSGNFNAVR